MGVLDFYRKRTLGDASSIKDSYINDMQRDFENFLKNDLSSQEYYYTKVDEFPSLETCEKELMLINDLTQNDKKAYDEKKVLVRKDLNIDVGGYLFFDNSWWLIIFKEHRTIDTFKKFIIKKCNQFINYNYRGTVYRIPVNIQALTLYSDGLADVRYNSYGDAKNRVNMGSNPITRTFDVGTRIMSKHKFVYRLTNITDFEYNGASTDSEGLISALVLQTTLIAEDDVENNIAYNPISVDSEISILGKDSIYLGEKNTYSLEYSDDIEYSLDFEYVNTYISDQGNNECVVMQNMSFDDIGNSVMLIAKDKSTNETVDVKNIMIRGM